MRIQPATLSLLLVLAAPIGAQKDWIDWTDGTRATGVIVRDFNLRQIKYRQGGKEEVKGSDLVRDLYVVKVRDRYRSALANPVSRRGAQLLETAERVKNDPMMLQFGYWEAFKAFMELGDRSQAFAALDELIKKVPESGFAARAYGAKIDVYLGRGEFGNAVKAAQRYVAAANGFPIGFVQSAACYLATAQGLAGDLKAKKADFEQVLLSTRGVYADVATRAQLQLAEIARLSEETDAAKSGYEELIATEGVSVQVRGGAWFGLGQLLLSQGNPADKEPYNQAMLAFMRVFLENREAGDRIVAEALYRGASAAEKFGNARASQRLTGRLKREYPDWQPGS